MVKIQSSVNGHIKTFTGTGAVISVFERESDDYYEFSSALVGDFDFESLMHAISNVVEAVVEELKGSLDYHVLEKCVVKAATDGVTRGFGLECED